MLQAVDYSIWYDELIIVDREDLWTRFDRKLPYRLAKRGHADKVASYAGISTKIRSLIVATKEGCSYVSVSEKAHQSHH
jgi:hypothetical protein